MISARCVPLPKTACVARAYSPQPRHSWTASCIRSKVGSGGTKSAADPVPVGVSASVMGAMMPVRNDER